MSEIEVMKLILTIGLFLISGLIWFWAGFKVRTYLYEKNPKIVYLVEKDKEKEE